MKNVFSLMLCMTWFIGYAQKHDFIWFLPYTADKNIKFDFNYAPVELTPLNITMHVNSSARAFLSDKDGYLLAYTNGLWIADKTGVLMENGDSINAGPNSISHAQIGYPIFNGSFFLPKPENSSQYYLFHMFKEKLLDPLRYIYSLRYSLLDFNYNNGLGKVLEKNIPVLTGDTVSANYRQATAVKHANGRDWWVLLPNHLSAQYFRLLVTPEGIFGPWVQETGFKEASSWFEPVARGLFSPDGTKYADYGLAEFIEVFDFDRCTGLLSNPFKIDIEWEPGINNGNGAVAFSPSGRFIYVTRIVDKVTITSELAQYDLQAADILSSKVVLASCIGNVPNPCHYGNMLLCPDGKIYIPSNGSNAFHTIHKPDEPGLACEFEYGGLVFPIEAPYGLLHYYPNYRLYDIPGSLCDTLGINAPVSTNEPEKENYKIFPNPASDVLHLSFTQSFKQPHILTLHDLAGRMVQQWQVPALMTEIGFSLADMPNGMFFWSLSSQSRTTANGKLIILK